MSVLRCRKISSNNCIFSALHARNMSFLILNEQNDKKKLTNETNCNIGETNINCYQTIDQTLTIKLCFVFFFLCLHVEHGMFIQYIGQCSIDCVPSFCERFHPTRKIEINNNKKYLHAHLPFFHKTHKMAKSKKCTHLFKSRLHAIYACETYSKRSVENAQIQM